MAANLSGWDLQDMTNGYEYKFIDCISKDILIKLCDGPLHVGENLVGIDFHFDKLNLSRFVGSDKVNMIGICGISGIGKTTLAKAIYNLMYIHFEGSCFCEDVKEVTKRQGLIQVQLHMIGKIMKIEDLKIPSVGEGIMVIKKMMSSKRILLVLDDVDDHKQLEALADSPTWFCPGSLIIFTGKDKHLLKSHRVDEDDIHDMDFLDEDRSLELFRSYAFKEKDSSKEFIEVSQKVVNYVQGHPLALKVLGRFLYGKTVGQWVNELEKLKVYPNKEIQQLLHLSYDGLDLDQKNILLDIACLFVGENMDFVASVLDGCNFFAVTNIQVLVDKSLITISSDMSLQMHNLILAMAREIVREESIMPGKHRILWHSSEVYNVLSKKKVPITESVEVLVLSLEKFSQKVHIDANDFAHMKNLRILKIYQEDKFAQESELKSYNVTFSGSFDFLSSELRLFCWHGFPFKYLPSDFHPENIVAIDLSYSRIKQLWTTPKCLRSLIVMNLRHCRDLTSTPDFSEIRNLKELSLEGCVNLVTVHPSIRMLKRLVFLNIKNCQRLSFPSNKKMDKLPEDLHVGENLLVGNPGASSIAHRWKYDVFVSFRGEDIHRNFMHHLFNDFKQKGIHAFRDDRELPKVSELDRLKLHPFEGMKSVLRFRYYELNPHQKNILLDIACSFIGENCDFAASVLDCCNFFADANIQVLFDQSLIMISSNKLLQMHDLIQAMAREIVHEESNTPGNRSRLWVNPSEIYKILSEKRVTQAVEILDILHMRSSQKFDIDGKAFAQMKDLRILKLPMDYLVNFSGRLEFLSNKLSLLCWHGCPFKLLPSDFYPENIVSINLSYSHIQDFWTTPLCFRRLKWMNLSYCHNLTSTPDFSEITNLEELSLEGCKNLVNVHPSIRTLKKLVVLNTNEEPEHFGPDALPRPDGMYRVSKSQRSSNLTASSGSNPTMFQEMLQQQYELDRKAKMDVLERESLARVTLYESQRIAEEMRVLQMETSKMDPINAAVVKAQQAKIRVMYHTDEE